MSIEEHKCKKLPDEFGIHSNDKWNWHLIEWDTWALYNINYCPFCGEELK